MSTVTNAIDDLFEGRVGAIPRDLKLNLKKVIEGGALDRADALFAMTALASALHLSDLLRYAETMLKELGASEPEMQEARDNAAIMGMLNVYYRFKHLTEHGDDYKSAGLRMTVFSNPVLEKTRFEKLAFAVSVLNGCESCVRSHERVLRSAGTSPEAIHELAKLASIMKGVEALNLRG